MIVTGLLGLFINGMSGALLADLVGIKLKSARLIFGVAVCVMLELIGKHI